MKQLIKNGRDICFIFYGIFFYFLTRRTPPVSYLAMIRLFCVAGGKTNRIVDRLLNYKRSYVPIELSESKLHVEKEQVSLAVRSLKSEGLYIFPQKVSAEIIESIYNFTLTQEALLKNGDIKSEPAQKRAVFDMNNPIALCYDYSHNQLLQCDGFLELVTDPGLLSIAQDYLGGVPLLDMCEMRWTTSLLPGEHSEIAQLYHFDMDRPRWVKFFVYLCDVGVENGPHVFIAKSHRDEGIPSILRKKGYARLKEEEVMPYYQSTQRKVIIGQSGTLFAEDTRGLHRALPVQQGFRLFLQIQYSSSFFGAKLPMGSPGMLDKAKRKMQKYPSIFSHSLFLANQK